MTSNFFIRLRNTNFLLLVLHFPHNFHYAGQSLYLIYIDFSFIFQFVQSPSILRSRSQALKILRPPEEHRLLTSYFTFFSFNISFFHPLPKFLSHSLAFELLPTTISISTFFPLVWRSYSVSH